MCDESGYRPPRTRHPHAGHPFGPGIGEMFGIGPKEMKMFGDMARKWMHGFAGGYGGRVPYNLEDKGDYYLISIPLSGRTKEEVKVSLINDTLNVKADKPKFEDEGNTKREKKAKESVPFNSHFFKFVKVDMDIQLPVDADKDTIKSLMQHGLLRIKIGKKPPKNIDVDEVNN